MADGRYGLAIDNLQSVNLVLADGSAVTASADEHPDLFWAVRGGGGNFGVATSFDYRLHSVGPLITGGLIAFPFSMAWDVLRLYRDITARLDDEMTVVGGLLHAPDGSKLAALVLCHCGPLEVGERAVQSIKHFGTPVIDQVGAMPYCALNTMLDAGYPRGALNYWKSSFLAALSDDAIRAIIDCFAQCPTPMGKLLLEHLHGAVTRVGPTETAFPYRREGFNLLFLSEWLDREQNSACVDWARKSYATVKPFIGDSRYVNYLDGDEGDDAIAAAYGPNYRRLQVIKSRYDPNNIFHMNQNVRPRA